MPDPELDDTVAWRTLADVRAWMQKTDADPRLAVINDARLAACAWIEDQRSDLQPTEAQLAEDPPLTFPTSRAYQIKQAGKVATERLLADPATFAELGSAGVLGDDPSVRALLGLKIVLG